MEENTAKSLNQLLLALKSLSKSVEKSYYHGAFQGVGDMVAKSYRTLHGHALELLPDDYYIRDVLALEVMPDANDKQRLGQVNLLVNQLMDYIESLVKTEQKANFQVEVDDLKGLGRDLSEQVISYTRQTLRRALSNIDVGMEGEPRGSRPPRPPVPPTPTVPQTPPTPPTPPSVPQVPPVPPPYEGDSDIR